MLKTVLILAACAALGHSATRQCEDYPNTPIQYLDGGFPEVIYLPSDFEIYSKTEILSSMPSVTDLVMNLTLIQTDPLPFPVRVPCVENPNTGDYIGSCEYELCPIIANMDQETCDQFPAGQSCSCPLGPGIYELNRTRSTPDLPDSFTDLMEGLYVAMAPIFSASNPSDVLGCLEFNFEFRHNDTTV